MKNENLRDKENRVRPILCLINISERHIREWRGGNIWKVNDWEFIRTE